MEFLPRDIIVKYWYQGQWEAHRSSRGDKIGYLKRSKSRLTSDF